MWVVGYSLWALGYGPLPTHYHSDLEVELHWTTAQRIANSPLSINYLQI
jgi:hypothetical protein